MKHLILLLAGLSLFSACKRNDDAPATGTHPKADSLERMMNKYTALGVPGTVVSIVDRDGSWEGAAGFARLEDSTRMSPAMVQYGFSITKIFTAVAIMQLKDQGSIDLDRSIETYLPTAQRRLVPGSDIVTIRMLLNHTSGYNDYVRTDAFATEFMADPMKVRSRDDYFNLIKDHTIQLFTPGSDFSYSNTNYFLLALMIDTIGGNRTQPGSGSISPNDSHSSRPFTRAPPDIPRTLRCQTPTGPGSTTDRS